MERANGETKKWSNRNKQPVTSMTNTTSTKVSMRRFNTLPQCRNPTTGTFI